MSTVEDVNNVNIADLIASKHNVESNRSLADRNPNANAAGSVRSL
jgi:hypothetical protein